MCPFCDILETRKAVVSVDYQLLCYLHRQHLSGVPMPFTEGMTLTCPIMRYGLSIERNFFQFMWRRYQHYQRPRIMSTDQNFHDFDTGIAHKAPGSHTIRLVYELAPSPTSQRTMAPTTTKVALVTGAAGGIGHAIAPSREGWLRCRSQYKRTPKLDEIVQEIERKGQRSLGVPADIFLKPEVEKVAQKVMQVLGSLDVVSRLTGGILVSSGWCLHAQYAMANAGIIAF
jgi:hypothetical protein